MFVYPKINYSDFRPCSPPPAFSVPSASLVLLCMRGYHQRHVYAQLLVGSCFFYFKFLIKLVSRPPPLFLQFLRLGSRRALNLSLPAIQKFEFRRSLPYLVMMMSFICSCRNKIGAEVCTLMSLYHDSIIIMTVTPPPPPSCPAECVGGSRP